MVNNVNVKSGQNAVIISIMYAGLTNNFYQEIDDLLVM